MDYFNYEWLGSASTSEEAIRIIKDTGIFYLTISIAYLLSFFHIFWHSSSTLKINKIHGISIFLWAFCGLCLILLPTFFSTFLNTLIIALSLFVLCQLYYISPLVAQVTLTLPETDDKKIMYAQTLIAKMHYTLSDMLKCTLINEQILWLLIFYRATITLRASLAL